MSTWGDQTRRSPAHAGRLRAWERVTITAAFVLTAAVIVTVMVSAGRMHAAGPQAGKDGTPTEDGAPLRTGGQWQSVESGGPGAFRIPSASSENNRLAKALAPVLQHRAGNLAVGVIQAANEAVAVYGGNRVFHAVGIIRADILAALLLQHQRSRTPLSGYEQGLAARMMEDGDGQAAATLWKTAAGLGPSSRLLLGQTTTPGRAASWELATTTVDDQLRLLTDLASRQSPLSASSRAYELGLMRHVATGQAWGVTAAATPGTSFAVDSNSLRDRNAVTWVVNSIGVISYDGHAILIAILSDGQPTEAAGVARVSAAARAAVSAIIGR
jgi:hypothetical protein